MSSDTGTTTGSTTGSTTSWEAVAFLEEGESLTIVSPARGDLNLRNLNLLPSIVTRKLTDPPSDWVASDDPILLSGSGSIFGSLYRVFKMGTWHLRFVSTIAFNEPGPPSEEQLRDSWFEILERDLKSQTEPNGIFEDQTVTLKLCPERMPSGTMDRDPQRIFAAAAGSTKLKTFFGGVEVQPLEVTVTETQTASTSA